MRLKDQHCAVVGVHFRPFGRAATDGHPGSVRLVAEVLQLGSEGVIENAADEAVKLDQRREYLLVRTLAAFHHVGEGQSPLLDGLLDFEQNLALKVVPRYLPGRISRSVLASASETVCQVCRAQTPEEADGGAAQGAKQNKGRTVGRPRRPAYSILSVLYEPEERGASEMVCGQDSSPDEEGVSFFDGFTSASPRHTSRPLLLAGCCSTGQPRWHANRRRGRGLCTDQSRRRSPLDWLVC